MDALYRDQSRKALGLEWGKQLFSWRNFFLALDRGLKLYERVPWKPLRQRALRQAREWMLEHLERSEGIGGADLSSHDERHFCPFGSWSFA